MKPNNNFNLTHSLLQTVREVVAGERSIAVRDVAAAAALERKRLRHSLRQKSAPRAKEPTVMISHGKGGGVKVIPKSQYNPKIHDLADEKEPMAAPVAKVDAKKMDRRKVIAKTIEKKKNGIKLSGKAEFVDVRPKMNEAHGEWEAQREFPGRDAFIVKAPDGKTYRVINGQSNAMAIRIAKSKRYSGEVKVIKKLNKEETEQNKSVDEEVEQVDEISRGLASRYIAKTKDSSSRKAGRALALKKKWGDKNYGTPEPRVKATEEVEQVDEISKATLGSYVKKASHDVATKSAATGRYGERSREHTKNAKSGPAHAYWGDTMAARDADKVADKFFKKSWARRQGIAKATDKLIKKEEVEQVDELSSNKLKNYAISATRTHDKLKRVNVSHDAEASGIKNRTMQNRAAGIAKATDKLTKT